MRLDYLCDMELTFANDPILVRPYGGEEGVAFDVGTGTITGERLRGTVRWANYPHRRSDGAMLPDLHGVIMTDEGATIIFSVQGRTVWMNTPRGPVGNQLLWVLFETEDQRYRWLNDVLCVLEGQIEAPAAPGHGRPRQLGSAHVYVCVNELL